MQIVFVHLGNNRAKHLWSNIQYLQRLFPEKKITLIVDDISHYRSTKRLNCDLFVFKRDNIVNKYLMNLDYDKDFRGGFWKYTIERFIALNQWHQANLNQKFLHLESDNLLLSTFPWEQFDRIESLAWLRHNNYMDSGAIFFSPSPSETSWLADEILNQINKNSLTNDMYILNNISQLYPKKVLLLPSYNLDWLNSSHFNTPKDINNDNKVEEFCGIFDPAAIGVWLTGSDPRNSLGWIKRYKSHFTPTLNSSQLSFTFKNRRLVGSGSDISEVIHNLHIHSKQKILFSRIGYLLLKFYVVTSSNHHFVNIYNPFVALNAYRDLKKDRKITPILIYKLIKALIKTRKTELHD
ncbi:MAG: hypothetical protein GM48_0135 [actinobacterium acIB-AMD-7]|nr:MAG: hypothetical protein GM48_0135 [actinobacterium acIB-AMD-7]